MQFVRSLACAACMKLHLLDTVLPMEKPHTSCPIPWSVANLGGGGGKRDANAPPFGGY